MTTMSRVESHVESRLTGFFQPDFATESRVSVHVVEGAPGMLDPEAMSPTRIHDGRDLQGSRPEAAFFEENGFVLLRHESAVSNWDPGSATPGGADDLARIYFPEIEALIRTRLLPGRRIDLWQAPLVRRGPGTENPDYALGVHQDYGLTLEDYQENLEAFSTPDVGRVWRDRFERDEVVGFLAIDFWRSAGMQGPIQHMPLALCHPQSVRREDLVPTGLLGVAPGGKMTNQLGVRWHEDQRWYSYSGMRPDEVLVFKQFQLFKDGSQPEVVACFHTAFEHPDTPSDAEVRQSSEHRVMIFLLE